MALAVAEAQRVLRPGGQVLDIHPQGAPLRLEAWAARDGGLIESHNPGDFERRVLGDLAPEAMVEDFIATTRALAGAAGHGFGAVETVNFDYCFVFDNLDDLTAYLEENEELDLASDELLERALLALRQASGPVRLVLVQPVIVTRLEKT